jgi:hypothetical protein
MKLCLIIPFFLVGCASTPAQQSKPAQPPGALFDHSASCFDQEMQCSSLWQQSYSKLCGIDDIFCSQEGWDARCHRRKIECDGR